MELGIILVLAVIAVWYGLLKPIETLAHSVDDEVQVLAAERKAVNIDRLAQLDVKDADVKKAQSNLERLNSIKL